MVALNRFFQKLSWDLVGFSASALCAIHCLVFPLLVLFGSFGSLGIAHNHTLENVILFFSAVVGITSLIPSFLNHHRRLTPLSVFIIGFILITISRFPVSSLWETLLTTSGASTIAFSHYLNWKLCRTGCDHSKPEVETADQQS